MKADVSGTIIELSFASTAGELDTIFVKSGGNVVHRGDLNGAFSRRKAKRSVRNRPKLTNRKISALGLLICKQGTADAVGLHESEPIWKRLLRILKDRETDPVPKWVNKVYGGYFFHFYLPPNDDDQALTFHSTARERIRVLIGGREADKAQLKALVTHYRFKCHNDATAVMAEIIPDAGRRGQIRDVAIRSAGFAFDEDLATMIGKFIWYSDWERVHELVCTQGDASTLNDILIETETGQLSLTDASDIQPLWDVLVGFGHRFDDVATEYKHLFQEVKSDLADIVARNSEGGVHANRVRSVAPWLDAIDGQFKAWNEFLKAELGTAASLTASSQPDSVRVRSVAMQQEIRSETRRLVTALHEFELLIIEKRGKCRDDFKRMTDLLALAPRDRQQLLFQK